MQSTQRMAKPTSVMSVSKPARSPGDDSIPFAHYTTVVCATGFDVSHRPRFPIVGRNGIDLRQAWVDDPESYVSVAVPEMPNYFMMMGPNCLGGHGSLVESLNWTGDYFVKWIYKMATEDIKCVQPKWDKVKAFTRYTDQVHKKLVWSGGCKSWYMRNRVDGRVTALFGGSAQLFNRLLSDIRSEDFEIEYITSNPFRFMGNGFTEFEMGYASAMAWLLLMIIAIFTAINFIASKFWVFYDN